MKVFDRRHRPVAKIMLPAFAEGKGNVVPHQVFFEIPLGPAGARSRQAVGIESTEDLIEDFEQALKR